MADAQPAVDHLEQVAPSPPPWHVLPAEEALARLAVDSESGLTSDEVAQRLARYGANSLPEEPGRSIGRMVLDQVADPMIALLVVAAIISGVIGEPADTIVIAVIVLLNAVIGVFQERRAEQAMRALKEMASPSALVLRDGVEQEVDAANLVPGDIVLLQDGAVVPADLRLLQTASLRISEAALTGESQPVGKQVEPVHDAQAAIGDRRSMAFRGTFVAGGRGRGVTVGTGLRTELGVIAGLLATAESVRTPLQQRLARFGGWIAIGVIAVSAVVFGAGLLRGEDPTLDVPHGHQPGGRGGAGGAARRGGRDPRPRRPAHGPHPRARAPAAGGRDARVSHVDLLGQDRDADREPHARRGRRAHRSRRSGRGAGRPPGRARAVQRRHAGRGRPRGDRGSHRDRAARGGPGQGGSADGARPGAAPGRRGAVRLGPEADGDLPSNRGYRHRGTGEGGAGERAAPVRPQRRGGPGGPGALRRARRRGPARARRRHAGSCLRSTTTRTSPTGSSCSASSG